MGADPGIQQSRMRGRDAHTVFFFFIQFAFHPKEVGGGYKCPPGSLPHLDLLMKERTSHMGNQVAL